MNEKKMELIKKLKALAERGERGERETAQKKLEQLMTKYGIEEEDLSDDVIESHVFEYHGEFERRLLVQVAYKVFGKAVNEKMYSFRRGKGMRSTRVFKCTKAEAIQIQIEYEFYRDLWKEEQQFFFECFIQKHRIFSTNKEEKVGNNTKMSKKDLLRMTMLMNGMETKSCTPQLEG